jgi:hypothetical protein
VPHKTKGYGLVSVVLYLLAAQTMVFPRPSSCVEWDHLFSISPQYRWFTQAPLDRDQTGSHLSYAVRAQLQGIWNNDNDMVHFIPFWRWDAGDDNRSHGDIRTASWRHISDGWETVFGISKVFWGVTESQHLVDIVNQTDLVESPDAEEKLGQPMLNLTLIRDWGTWDLFLLGKFRERTFPGREGRLRSAIPVNEKRSVVDRHSSGADFAIRWSQHIGDWDLALSHFSGTSREPNLAMTESTSRALVLQPSYPLINQTGLEVQITQDAWLWKLEAIDRNGGDQDHNASVFGFEYTHFGVAKSVSDLGLIAEYNYDSRRERATTGLGNDLFLAIRWQANDADDRQLLVGSMLGLDSDGDFFILEGSTRIGDNSRLSVDGRFFIHTSEDEVFYDMRNDNFLQIGITFFF